MKAVKFKHTQQFTDDQNNAINHFLNSYFQYNRTGDNCWCYSLSGYAGTGKTYIIAELLQQLYKHNVIVPVALTAPTNKAVGVLCDRIQSLVPNHVMDLLSVNFGTIHSFLKLEPDKKPDGTLEFKVKESDPNKIPIRSYRLVIVDECSMIGTELKNLIDATIRCSTVIVYVGDIAQLPPVEKDTISDTFSCKYGYQLSQTVRQKSDNQIIKMTMDIREKYHGNIRTTLQDILIHEGADIQFVPASVVVDAVVKDVQEKRIDSRILCYTNRAVTEYNRLIHERVYGTDSDIFMVGERAIVHAPYRLFNTKTQNDIISGTGELLINSEECIICDSIDDEAHIHGHIIPIKHLRLRRDMDPHSIVDAIVPIDTEYVDGLIKEHFAQWRKNKQLSIKAQTTREQRLYRDAAKKHSDAAWDMKERFLQLRHSYAMTVHKSQGSTFDRVYVDWNDINYIRDIDMFNQCLYVASTRPSKDLVILT